MTIPESFSSTSPGPSEPQPSVDRLHRHDAQREAPIRNVFVSRTTSADPTADTSKPNSEYADKLAYGVDLGYNVINEQIAKARELAAQWSGHSGNSSPTNGHADWQHIASRMLHAYQDLGAVYLDAMQKLIEKLTIEEAQTASEKNGNATPAAASTPASTHFTIKLRTAVPAEADLQLNPGSGSNLTVTALHGPLDAPPITSCTFTAIDEHQVALLVEVAAGTPPGVYSGVVVDTYTNEPCGTLCVRVDVR